MTTRDFSFPLNVFADLLQVQEGRCDYLHFAAFESPDEPVLQAQERATALLWEALPPPCRLLEVGIGLGTTLARLGAAGYSARGITPEQAQVDQARERHGSMVDVAWSRLEDYDGDAGQWQALLFQESAQYIAPLDLFAAAERLLQSGPATLVVMDEFALRRSEPAHWGLHHLGGFVAMAERFGWRLVQHTDLSAAVQPTLGYLLRSTQAQRPRLRGELGLSEPVLDDLDSALQRSQTLYRQGVFGYALLRFDRDEAPAERLHRLAAAESAATRRLFHQVFGSDLSAEEWHWKYGDGRGQAVGMVKHGELLAHYGGLTREVLIAGEPALACQVCDVMVHPQARQTLARKGPLHKVTASFLESQIGWGQRHRLGFGFPTERAFAVADRLGLYSAVDRMVCASWPASPVADAVATAAIVEADLAAGAPVALAVDAAWQAMAQALPEATLGVRHARWVLHRYLRHPRFRYELHLVQTPTATGLLVLRRHAEHLEWVDAVAAPAAWPALLAGARRRAADEGLARVDAWITESHRSLLADLAPDAAWRPLGIDVPGNAHSPGPGAESQRGRWLLMAGDTDFR